MNMARSLTLTLVLCLCVFLATQTHGKTEAEFGTSKKPSAPTITITKLNVTDTTLELRYQIRNDFDRDVWLCDGLDVGSERDFEAYLAEDGQTLMVRRRHDVPMRPYRSLPCGRYVRFPAGQTRTESLLVDVPISPRRVFSAGRKAQGTEYAKRLEIEIGFYSGDLPGMIYGMLDEAEKDPRTKHVDDIDYPTDVIGWLGGSVYFAGGNEGVRDRDEEVIIPYTHQTLKGEQVLRAVVEGVRIPYQEKYHWRDVSPPDLTACTRIEIRYQPSMLEFFFPYASQQNLLSRAEREYLQSGKSILVDDVKRIEAFAAEIKKGYDGGRIVTDRTTAHVTCYRDGEHLTSFTIYNDTSIVTEEQQRFRYSWGLQSLNMLTVQIRPFELRVQCAKNLKDLWHRLRLHHKAKHERLKDLSSKIEMSYPAPTDWCDVIVRAVLASGALEEATMRPHKCPSAGEGKSHYAMNPHCRPDSPPDTVLLFETKAGWNQHGGPELFTFDNHDPRGGCVLLNDGTVKFIRSKEELAQLRWK
jgi:hypothetical protein